LTDDRRALLGVDVGTHSVRAALFSTRGELLGRGDHPIQTWRPRPDHVEQSSSDIWNGVCTAVQRAVDSARIDPRVVVGMGCDATCSLVAVGLEGEPVTVSVDGDAARDVIVWMDHRAVGDAAEINATGHPVLQFVGGTVSPEMQTPKLRWVKRELPETWRRVDRWFDLADYLTWRATGRDVRSLCTTVCKWTYLGHDATWDRSFFDAVGLADLADNGFRRIGSDVHPPGENVGTLTEAAAAELGLDPRTVVGVPLIDAHAGALGMIGADGDATPVERRLAVIAGTSACHLAVSAGRLDVPGVWGPYFGALLGDHWLLEAGISASGAFVDHVVRSHPAREELGDAPFAALDSLLRELASSSGDAMALTRDRHLQPNVLGNRAPLADPSIAGGIAGWRLRDDLDDLAGWHLAALQSLAYATRHIVEAMTDAGASVDLVIACGGSATDDWWLRSHADALGIPIALPAEPEAVLLGAAMLGATAAGVHPSSGAAMSAMTRLGRRVEPDPATKAFHDAKYRVYRQMLEHDRDYRAAMRDV
jgi:FGGY-family pentulose kinase